MFHDNDAHFINGITLNVRDLRTLQPFYEELLGFKKVEETLTAVKYQIGDSHHYITLREIKSGRNPLSQEAGLFYIGIQLSNKQHLADLIEKLNDYELPINGGEQNVCTFIFVEDPEGHMFKFYVDKAISDWKQESEWIRLDIKPLDVSSLLPYASTIGWQGLPNDSKIGNISLKTIRLNEVREYYLNHFGLVPSAYLDDESFYLASEQYYCHLSMNQWNSKIKRIDNEHTYGLSIVDFHYPETHHINIKGPDGIQFRFNFIEVE